MPTKFLTAEDVVTTPILSGFTLDLKMFLELI